MNIIMIAAVVFWGIPIALAIIAGLAAIFSRGARRALQDIVG